MARRIAASAIDWAGMSARVTAEQRASFLAFKQKSDGYLRQVIANPAESPKIDWAFYKKSVPIAGMVDNFQKQYEALKIPYPADTLTAEVEKQESEVKNTINKFVTESNGKIQQYQAELTKLKSLLSYSDMTMEEFAETHPDIALDAINRPTFWPHNPEEQMDYQDEEGAHQEKKH